MQQVNSTSHQIALNSRFGFETNWNKVTNPSGGNIISKVANAALALIVNTGKLLVNIVLAPINKIHSFVYPNAANVSSPVEDVEIQQDSVIVDLIDEELPEPVVLDSNKTLQKVAFAGAAVLLTAALVGGVEYVAPGVPGVTQTHNFIFTAIPEAIAGGANFAKESVVNGAIFAKDVFCKATFETICSPGNYTISA
jgi:hypothetical protein